MNIVIMDFGPRRHEKTQHFNNLVPRLAVRPGVKLLLVSGADSALAEIAGANKLDFISCNSNGKVAELVLRLKLNWRLRKAENQALLHCFDQKSLALATRIAAKKDHLNIIYSALRPEPIIDKQIIENIHLIGAVIAGTKEIASQTVTYGFLQSSVFVIPDALDSAPYMPRRQRNDGRIIFACSDPLEPGRGYTQLLQALAYLYGYQDMPQWEVRLARSGPMFEEFLEKAAEMNVVSRLGIFGGFPATEILQDCDALISPAELPEGSSISVKEGWASGLPVICSDISSHGELVRHGQNGLLYQNNNPADLADKMFTLAKNAELRASLAQNGSDSLNNYSCEILLNSHVALYRKTLGLQEARRNTDI